MVPPMHGMGHQIGTYTSGLIVSLIFGLTFAEGGFKDETYHGHYPSPGIGNFTGLHENEIKYSEIEKQVKDMKEKKSNSGTLKIINIDEQPTEPFTSNYYQAYEHLDRVFNDKYKDECNVLFKLKEFYSYDYGSFTKWIEAQKFQGEAVNRPNIPLFYSADYFNIAVHIRVGDIMPTKEPFFVNVRVPIPLQFFNFVFHFFYSLPSIDIPL